jgi:DNA-binding LacI/PurR family transcriptional regulator
MAITIKDIAKQAGVAHTTVSRALRGSPLIPPETTERIRQIAAELGYRPSAAARSLKTSRSQVLGVVVSSLDDPFFSEILQGIESVAQECGYSLFVAASQHDPQREQKIVQAMVEHRADGVIICSTPFSAEQARQLLEYGRPIVVVNNQSAEDYRYSIYHDDVDGSRQITRHLIDLGHRRIAYLGNAASGRTSLDRLSGFQQEMAAAGLTIPAEYIFQAAGGGAADGLAAVGHFLALPERPTALVCFNDMMAVGVLKGLQQAGLRLPEDCSVTGFDNITFSAYTQPALTTFDQPKRFIGAEAARLVLGLLQSPASDETSTEPEIRLLKGQLLVRESTALAK